METDPSMSSKRKSRVSVGEWGNELVAPGETRNVKLAVGESYSGMTVRIPIQIRRAKADGPVVFVTGALHGDEINGTGAIRTLILDESFQLIRGSVILVPVLNILGFDRHSRYLPDRRDLNRCFPGKRQGSLASRMARVLFDEIVRRSDFGIDLHTAAIRRTNYPNIRGHLADPGVRRIAEAFGCEILIDSEGPRGAFRREACRAGCPTIVMEGGEVWKVEPGIVESAAQGVRNVLRNLEMLDGESTTPDCQVTVTKTRWVRAELGGFLQFHIKPGDFIEKGQPLVTNSTLLGRERSVIESPYDAVVIGMTTLPAVSPGEPVCNLGKLPKGIKPEQLSRRRRKEDGLGERVAEDLQSNVMVVEPSSEQS